MLKLLLFAWIVLNNTEIASNNPLEQNSGSVEKLCSLVLIFKKAQVENNVFISQVKPLLTGKIGRVISAHLLVILLYFPTLSLCCYRV